MGLEVVGACLPRTGTMSLKLALEQLGFGPCYTMPEAFSRPETWPVWEKALTTGEPPRDWDAAMPGYRACADAPSCFFYAELAKANPDAKIIMTTRSPQSWLRSVRATVGSQEHHEQLWASPVGTLVGSVFGYVALKYPSLGAAFVEGQEEIAMAAFEDWQEDVRRTIAPERLLVFEAEQGWVPLCEFLGVPVPDAPYPRVNSTEDFIEANGHIPAAA